jgi:hypothetical protein
MVKILRWIVGIAVFGGWLFVFPLICNLHVAPDELYTDYTGKSYRLFEVAGMAVIAWYTGKGACYIYESIIKWIESRVEMRKK